MNELQIFEGTEVIIEIINGEPHFEIYSTGMALGHVKSSKGRDYPRKERIDENLANAEIMPVVHDGQLFINESQLYDFMLEAKTDKCKKFRKWVTHEVLPSIRKHGAYMTETTIDNIINDPDFGIQLLSRLKVERETIKRLELENKEKDLTISLQGQQIGELKPKADYVDTILQSQEIMPIKAIAKDYGMSSQEMNILLHELGIQYKQAGMWFLYKEHQANGYTQSKTYSYRSKTTGRVVTKLNTEWTQKGRLFLYNILKENGCLPTIERENLQILAFPS